MPQQFNQEKLRGEIFLEPDEKLLCVMGSARLERFLDRGKVQSCFAVLSDRAVYCKGRCRVTRDWRHYQIKPTNFRLDLEEFKGLRYLQQRNQVLLSLAFFFLLLGPTLLLLDKLTGFGERVILNPTLDAVICILLAGVFFLLYSIHQKTLLELLHTNGTVGLYLAGIPEKEERLLIRYLQTYLNALDKAGEKSTSEEDETTPSEEDETTPSEDE